MDKQDEMLRQEIARVLHKAIRQFEGEGCPVAFDLKVHIDQIVAKVKQHSEQKGLERPEREKIDLIIESETYIDENGWRILPSGNKLTRRFLALIPDIEEAKREERERIIKYCEEGMAKLIGYDSYEEAISDGAFEMPEYWQALKGEK